MARKRKPHFTYEFVGDANARQFYKDMRSKHPTIIMEVDGCSVKFIGTGHLCYDENLKAYADEVARDTGGKMTEKKYFNS